MYLTRLFQRKGPALAKARSPKVPRAGRPRSWEHRRQVALHFNSLIDSVAGFLRALMTRSKLDAMYHSVGDTR